MHRTLSTKLNLFSLNCCQISHLATAQPSCEAVVDVAFILDSSGSLRTEYQKEKNFLKTLAAVFGISENGSRAGVITFSYYAEHSIKLHNFTDLNSFNKAVDNIPLMGSTTRIDRALRLAQKEMFSQRNGGRVGVTKLILLLTDGSQTPGVDVEEPGDIGEELRKEGISIVVIGIGPGVNQTELAHISGGEANAYSAATFDKLLDSDFLHRIKNGSCEIGSLIYFHLLFSLLKRGLCLFFVPLLLVLCRPFCRPDSIIGLVSVLCSQQDLIFHIFASVCFPFSKGSTKLSSRC